MRCVCVVCVCIMRFVVCLVVGVFHTASAIVVSANQSLGSGNVIMVVSAGPCGSGKTNQQKYLKEKLLGKDVVEIKIDDYVENDPVYKRKVTGWLKSAGIKGETNAEYVETISEELRQDLNDIYFSIRNTDGCKEHANTVENKGCDAVSDKNFAAACSKTGESRVINENTGGSYPSWFIRFCGSEALETPVTQSKLETWFAGNLVNYCELRKRNVGRAVQSINDFIIDGEKPAPRLPNLDKLKDGYKSYILTMRSILSCFRITLGQPSFNIIEATDYWRHPCSGVVNKVLIFDNNKKELADPIIVNAYANSKEEKEVQAEAYSKALEMLTAAEQSLTEC